MEQCETEGCSGVVFKQHLCLVCANKLFDTATSSDARTMINFLKKASLVTLGALAGFAISVSIVILIYYTTVLIFLLE